jgi:hypothetical protein
LRVKASGLGRELGPESLAPYFEPSVAERFWQLFSSDQQGRGEYIYIPAAIRGLVMAPALFPEVRGGDLHTHLLRFAEGTLARRRRRSDETRVDPDP